MPETTSRRQPDGAVDQAAPLDPVAQRVHAAQAGLNALLSEAEEARRQRAEAASTDSGAVCAWNHFENIPTFYNWNNRPR
ncbi:multiple cyclophane-containing RiPP AmcA [Phytohabitans kaempferiae]|uniref:Multiple cyclophane-containing RiPP AmcA n=1 Tax=Phytohabitans kaempferiae TaxID=1620943 RepID=A0ABV6LUZ5_9ACTN